MNSTYSKDKDSLICITKNNTTVDSSKASFSPRKILELLNKNCRTSLIGESNNSEKLKKKISYIGKD